MQYSTQRSPYLIPFVIAFILHLSVLIFLIAHQSNEAPQQVGLNSNVHVISAVVLSEAKTNTQTPPKAAKPAPKPEPKAEVKPIPEKKVEAKAQPTPVEKALPTKAEAKSEPKTEPKKPIKALPEKPMPTVTKAQIQEKALKEKQRTQKLNAEKAAQLQKLQKQLLLEEQKKMNAQKQKSAAAAKALQQKLVQEQLASEQRHLKTAAQEQQQAMQLQGKLDQYKSQIIAAISQYWIVPPETSKAIYTQLLIHVTPTGDVLNVELLHSSGDPLLDRSARAAVMQASPLPVPKDPKLFDSFRELRLSFKPEGIIR